MEDFIEGEHYAYEGPWEVDSDYEFDASCFFDFTRPETCSEAEQADDWFYHAHTYPPSPFIVKLNLGKVLASEQACTPSRSEGGRNTNSASSNSANLMPSAKAAKSRSSTLMKPTASLLAKQDTKLQGGHYSQSGGRVQKSSVKLDEKCLQSPPGFENQATKRQKLDSGFLRKVSRLKHQSSLIHKKPKKVTVPKEPQLETMQRAQMHRSRNSAESSKNTKPKVQTFKARPLNRKEPEVSADDQNPPIEMFSRLCIKPGCGSNLVSQTRVKQFAKGSKENSPSSFHLQLLRSIVKPNQCDIGSTVNNQIRSHTSISRSLDIR